MTLARVQNKSSEDFQVICSDQHILVSFERPMLCSSWAIKGGGFRVCTQVVNMKVSSEDLRPPVEAIDVLNHYCDSKSWSDSIVGLMTSANIKEYTQATIKEKNLEISALVTSGMGNARRIGDPTSVSGRIGLGTINIICWSNTSVSRDAHFEAMSIIAEARTAAVLESKIPSPVSSGYATGTGTDCIAFLSPYGNKGLKYAGKHTVLGSCIGQSVYQSLKESLEKQGW